jgi:hypothetical protein
MAIALALTLREKDKKDLVRKMMSADKPCRKCGNTEFEEMRKPDGQLDLFLVPGCRQVGDSWTLSMLSLWIEKALIKAMEKLGGPKTPYCRRQP